MTYYLYWMKSNRGTNIKVVRRFKKNTPKEMVQEDFEYWSENQSAMHHGDNIVEYGYKRIKIPPRPALLNRWREVCIRYEKANEERMLVMAMLNPSDRM